MLDSDWCETEEMERMKTPEKLLPALAAMEVQGRTAAGAADAATRGTLTLAAPVARQTESVYAGPAMHFYDDEAAGIVAEDRLHHYGPSTPRDHATNSRLPISPTNLRRRRQRRLRHDDLLTLLNCHQRHLLSSFHCRMCPKMNRSHRRHRC